ncbi:precorrin-3B synthase [Hydrogenophaga sp.]|uniref:precorrin-3B synthase n=1 Tax=Hydrogenophaga sp. TaxID=1904254 RepID=UPI0027318DA0|nr:precorrin-3B synthase [Hydrogenophaga sp.]MDP2015697.1 precorrin-3B synthase [Hydrogenophaga sp.]MDP3164773.1 precorrin-3B synthase [Hydrogenophaga sp.]MDP3810681.1 precorrin-3B synthase [Hydrogenophaga sp.]
MTDFPVQTRSSQVQIKGWCPGAWQPMAASDGLVVRVRPPGGRLSQAQAHGIAELVRCCASPWLELTNRANLQLRGVNAAGHVPLLDALRELDLLDRDAAAEARRNVQVQPLWTEGDTTQTLALQLGECLARADAPALPPKFGFTVDTGEVPCLRGAYADIRLERYAQGVLVYADGATLGGVFTPEEAPAGALALARWFLAAGGAPEGRGRMAALLTRCDLPVAWQQVPVPAAVGNALEPGPQPGGTLVGLAFGLTQASTLAALADGGALRLTPWRSVYVEGAAPLPDFPELITDTNDARLRIAACTGAPHCQQAWAPTRDLALALAPLVPSGQLLHVSGCAKGCAYPKRATTVVATAQGYDFIRHGTAACAPDHRGLALPALEQLLKNKTTHAPRI